MVRHDVRPAIRSLMRAPTVSISAILCLSLGLGVTAAVSSALDRALLQPLPFRDPDQLMTVYRTTPQATDFPSSAPNFVDLAGTVRMLPDMAAMADGTALVSLADQALQVRRVRVTGGMFSLLGVPAFRGRLITAHDDSLGQPRVVVLSEAFWRRTFGGDPSILSRTIQIDGEPVTVVGILPPDFAIPHGGRLYVGDLWEPMRFSENELSSRGSNYLRVLGRLAPGATPAAAERELVARFATIVEAHPELRGESMRAVGMRGESLAPVRAPLLLLFGAVFLVLLIASTNVASLLLARGVRRQRELAVRTALGASRWDVMRPVLVESFLLAMVGVAGGLALATVGVRTIGRLAAARMPQLTGLQRGRARGALRVGAGVRGGDSCADCFPRGRGRAWIRRTRFAGDGGAGRARRSTARWARWWSAQVALSLVLLIGAGLVLKGFTTLLGSDPGFDPDRMLTLEVHVARQRYDGQSIVRRFLEPALDEIARIPGVAAAGATHADAVPQLGMELQHSIRGAVGREPDGVAAGGDAHRDAGLLRRDATAIDARATAGRRRR